MVKNVRNDELLSTLGLIIFFKMLAFQVLILMFYVHPIVAVIGFPMLGCFMRIWHDWPEAKLRYKQITGREPPTFKQVLKRLLLP